MKTKKTNRPKVSNTDAELLACFDSPSDLVFWSFRYFLGRMTIATCCFAESLAKGWKHLNPRIQELIKNELEREFARDDEARKGRDSKGDESVYLRYLPLGHDCDREAWQKVRDAYTK